MISQCHKAKIIEVDKMIPIAGSYVLFGSSYEFRN